jgi:hypothetical protein
MNPDDGDMWRWGSHMRDIMPGPARNVKIRVEDQHDDGVNGIDLTASRL